MRFNYQAVIFHCFFLIAITNCRPPSSSYYDENQRLRDLQELKTILGHVERMVMDYQVQHNVQMNDNTTLHPILGSLSKGERDMMIERYNKIIRQDPEYFFSKICKFNTEDDLKKRCASFRQFDQNYQRQKDLWELIGIIRRTELAVQNYQMEHNVTIPESIRNLRFIENGGIDDASADRAIEIICQDREYFLSKAFNFTKDEFNQALDILSRCHRTK